MAGPGRGENARTRLRPSSGKLFVMLGPSLTVTLVLFGGGLFLGAIQALGYMPAAGLDRITVDYLTAVIFDSGFVKSLGLTVYVAASSTIIAAAIGVALSLVFAGWGERGQWVRFIFQVPLAVPHLVIGAAVLFMLAPSGWIARLWSGLGVWAGVLDGPADFPVLTNDPFCVGIIVTYVWKEVPFITLMVLSALKSSGLDLIEVGQTLGASRWQRFRHITLPIIFPSLGAASLIVFAYSFGAFEVPYILGRTYPALLPVTAYKMFKDVEPAVQVQGIATGIMIALLAASVLGASQLLTRAARKRGAAI